MLIFLATLLAVLIAPEAAHAGPVFFAVLSAGGGLGSAFAATALGGFLSTTVGRLLMSVALSALQAALIEKPKPPGIVTETTLTGSTSPLSFTIGLYATGGQLAAPPMSHGTVGGVPNAYRTYVVTLGAVPGTKLSRLMINGEYVDLGTTPHADYGLPVLGRYEGWAWVKYYDGTQTTADSMLLAKYGSDPDRPWSADMVGTNLCYAILTFRYSQKIWTSGEPGWRIELKDTPLYDPRKDSTVGGSGAHRWANKATWEGSNNPIVQAFNIKRGIELPGLGTWGGSIPTSDLPLSDWFAAMNACDQTVTRPGGATEPRYRTGYEIKVNVEPAAVLEELFKASATRIAEVGGLWKPRTGGPGLPVWFMTDDDIIVTSPQELDPFPGADQRFNGISTNGPHPDAVWEAEPDPELYNATWEAEDGGKRRMASLQLPACPYPLQRQRVARAFIRDERRFLRHQLTLPPDAAILEPLDTLGWTSARNGYVTKHFEIGELRDDLPTILQSVSLREVDPTDFTDPAEYGEIVTPIPTARRAIPAQTLDGFAASTGSATDADGKPRRAHIVITWTADGLDGVGGIEWEVRLSTGAVHVARGSTSNVEAGTLRIFEGIIANTTYQVRARQIAVWPVAWTAWASVTSPDTRFVGDDLADDVNTSEGGNVFPDFDMTRRAFWFVSSGLVSYGFGGVSNSKLGANCLKIAVSGLGGSVCSKWFRVDPDAEYRAEAAAWINNGNSGATGTASVYIQTAAVDAAGVVDEAGLAETLVKTRTDIGYNATGAHGAINVSPRSTDRVARFRVYRAPGGTGEARAAGFRLRRRVKSAYVGDEQIMAAAMNKVDLEAAGVSIFNNTLKSSNYAESGGIPTAGWKLTHDGTFKGKNIILRDAINDGAVTDKTQSVLLGPQDFTTTANEVLLLHSVGPVAFGSILKRGIVFEARNVSTMRNVTLVTQIRRKYAGVWDAWEQLNSWTIGPSTSAWALFTSSATLAGAYDDVQYRLTATTSAPDTFNGIRNLYITTVNVVK